MEYAQVPTVQFAALVLLGVFVSGLAIGLLLAKPIYYRRGFRYGVGILRPENTPRL